MAFPYGFYLCAIFLIHACLQRLFQWRNFFVIFTLFPLNTIIIAEFKSWLLILTGLGTHLYTLRPLSSRTTHFFSHLRTFSNDFLTLLISSRAIDRVPARVVLSVIPRVSKQSENMQSCNFYNENISFQNKSFQNFPF